MKFAALFLWLILPLTGYATYQLYGTPHGLWRYEFRPNGDPFNPHAYRHYTSCTYVGWRWHSVTLPAENARCPWVRLLKGPHQ